MSKFFNHSLLRSLLLLFCTYLLLVTTKGYSGEVQGQVVVQIQDETKKWVPAKSHDNVVLYFTGIKDLRNPKTFSMNQLDQVFIPRVLAIQVGDTVEFENKDKIFHNVWSLSKPKKFDLGTFKAPLSKSVTFDKPGLVKVFCDIHPQMIGSILVLKNKYFTVSDANGAFKISHLPQGKYKLRAWVEGAKPVVRDVIIEKEKPVKISIKVQKQERSINHTNKKGKPYKSY